MPGLLSGVGIFGRGAIWDGWGTAVGGGAVGVPGTGC